MGIQKVHIARCSAGCSQTRSFADAVEAAEWLAAHEAEHETVPKAYVGKHDPSVRVTF
jgi:hypothetical protein